MKQLSENVSNSDPSPYVTTAARGRMRAVEAYWKRQWGGGAAYEMKAVSI